MIIGAYECLWMAIGACGDLWMLMDGSIGAYRGLYMLMYGPLVPMKAYGGLLVPVEAY